MKITTGPCLVGCAALLGLLAVGRTAGQPPAAPPDKNDTIEVRPRGDVRGNLSPAQRRTKLLEEVKQLIAVQEVKDRAAHKLRQGHDGTGLSALRIHLLEIEIHGDQAPVVNKLGETVYDVRADLRADCHEKRELVKQREDQVRQSHDDIQSKGKLILEGKDEKGCPFSPEELDTLRAVLHQYILRRNERQADVERYKDDVKAYEEELAELDKLEHRLDGIAEVEKAYLARLMDAVENAREGLVKQEVVEGRKQLQELVAALEERAKKGPGPIPDVRGNKEVRQGVPVQGLGEVLRPRLKPDEMKLVEEELRKLQEQHRN